MLAFVPRPRLLLSGLLLAVILCPAAALCADDRGVSLERGVDHDADQRARQLYRNGVTLFDEAEYALAVEAFEEAWELSRRPDLLFNISASWERLGEFERALEALNRYRVYAEEGEMEELTRRVRRLRDRIAATAATEATEAAEAAQREARREPRREPQREPDPVAAEPEDDEPLLLDLGREERRTRPKRATSPTPAGPILMASGAVVGSGFGIAAALSYDRALAAREVGDQATWEGVRPLNNGSLAAMGVGASVFVAGVIVAAVEGSQARRVSLVPAVVPHRGGAVALVAGTWPARAPADQRGN